MISKRLNRLSAATSNRSLKPPASPYQPQPLDEELNLTTVGRSKSSARNRLYNHTNDDGIPTQSDQPQENKNVVADAETNTSS